MNHDDVPPTTAWLLMSVYGHARGVLEVNGGRLSYTIQGSGLLARRHVRKLEKRTGLGGLADSLWKHDALAELFDVPLAAVGEVSSPWHQLGCGMTLTAAGQRYRFTFIRPEHARPSGDPSDLVAPSAIPQARRTAQLWRTLLADAGR